MTLKIHSVLKYETTDGKTFEDHAQAKWHQAKLNLIKLMEESTLPEYSMVFHHSHIADFIIDNNEQIKSILNEAIRNDSNNN